MKLKLTIFLLLISLVSADYAFASFPVTRTTNNTTTEISVDNVETEALSSPAARSYDKWIALALWFFLGGFAAHRWYAGKPTGWNILYILTFGGLGIWAIVDLINILIDKFEN